jgi:membrane peptidoglycan carboxypeptidase
VSTSPSPSKPLSRVWRRIAWSALISALTLLSYSAYVVFDAKQRTTRDVLPMLATLQAPTLSERQQAILLSVEDPNFLHHHGVDFSTPGAGYTTITQGLVKRLYFDDFKPGWRKFPQTLIAYFVLDPQISKQDQLRLLISKAYMGRGPAGQVYGFDAAALAYFGKPFGQLSELEYIGLVGMLIAPNNYSPQRNPQAYAERVSRIQALIEQRYQPKYVSDLYYDQS